MKRLAPLLALFMALNCPAANAETNYIYYAAGTDDNGGKVPWRFSGGYRPSTK